MKVLLFAAFREAAGQSEISIEAQPVRTARDLWAILVERHPGLAKLPPSVAVNAVFVPPETELAEGDEVAFLPPVSGG